MKITKWFDRKFDQDLSNVHWPKLLERLSTTSANLESKLSIISNERLNKNTDGAWSIKEHIGHLADLEPLWQGRLKDILVGNEYLRPTDLNNTITTEANHNKNNLTELLTNFYDLRLNTLAMLAKLQPNDFHKSALHPRLLTPMQPVNLFIFVAEHDDHHLAHITNLLTK